MAEEKYKVGDRFGKWTLKMKLARGKSGSRWLVICDCGLQKIVWANNLRSGKSKGCTPCGAKEREKRFREEGQYGRGPK